jgi:hypothetical protein
VRSDQFRTPHTAADRDAAPRSLEIVRATMPLDADGFRVVRVSTS